MPIPPVPTTTPVTPAPPFPDRPDANPDDAAGPATPPPTDAAPAAIPFFLELQRRAGLLHAPAERIETDFDNTFEPPHLHPAGSPVDIATRTETHAELEDFVLKPVPMGQKLLCSILRRRGGDDPADKGSSLTSPRYEMYIEDGDNTPVFVLAARKRKKAGASVYTISTTRFGASSGSLNSQNVEGVVGKVKSNFVGTTFTIYDKHKRGSKTNASAKSDSSDDPAAESTAAIREELGVVTYEPNLLGFKGPRKMTVVVPAMTRDARRLSIRPTHDSQTILRRLRASQETLLKFHNKAPQWNDETQSYVLNFSGRVTLASVKNFQIVPEEDNEYIILQFGRVGDEHFTVDFQYPMSCVQAFAIALTSFDAKLLCE
ncbi:tubby C-terminal-like domain-containing protein [Fimicolochytrium jonesii]|uniref:tubby C-terminal-like domain-containing protein n=1 Tax=Fimicolochytrium jonesii TaxID=1396493 RepID=UPI0022FE61B6|nr:tubby C-terminal-like domain-containing protein [Fimicolochytrium jonesii]KAI8823052.1 tubby C-terminal-like domain-containing protein [Fimicolochytrium jonesii]